MLLFTTETQRARRDTEDSPFLPRRHGGHGGTQRMLLFTTGTEGHREILLFYHGGTESTERHRGYFKVRSLLSFLPRRYGEYIWTQRILRVSLCPLCLRGYFSYLIKPCREMPQKWRFVGDFIAPGLGSEF